MVIHAWSRMLRLPNLLMIVIIQSLTYSSFIRNNFLPEELALTDFQFFLCMLTLLMIASSGYVINNIYDIEIDSLEVHKSIIPQYFSKKQAWLIFEILAIGGLIPAIYLSYTTGFHYSILFYPLTLFCLWLYSYKLKCLPLIGNLLISTLTAFVIAIIPFIYWENLQELRISDYNTWSALMYRFVLLFILAFLSNLAREIVKDIEDTESDKRYNCRTTANAFGIKTNSMIALNVWFALAVICISAIWFADGYRLKLYSTLFLGIPSAIIFIQLLRASYQKDYSRISLFMKLFMLLGVFYWCVIA